MDPMLGTFLSVLGMIGAVVIFLIYIYFWTKRSPSTKYSPEASWQEYSTFKESIKSGGSKPEKIISYGKTYFTYDEAGRKIFIQTKNMTEGMMLSSEDIVSFELYQDGKAIDTEAAGTDIAPIESGPIVRSCSDLHIAINLKNGSKTILPMIDTPVQYEYVYIRALDVAKEISAVLNEIINKRR